MENIEYIEFFKSISRLKRLHFVVDVGGPVKFTETMILAHLMVSEDNPEIEFNVKKVREILKISQPAVSQSISILEEKGLIERHVDKEDRRKIQINLTDRGREEVMAVRKRMDDAWNAILSEFTHDELETFYAFTKKIVAVGEAYTKAYMQENGDL